MLVSVTQRTLFLGHILYASFWLAVPDILGPNGTLEQMLLIIEINLKLHLVTDFICETIRLLSVPSSRETCGKIREQSNTYSET